QSGGGENNHALNDILVGIENLTGTNDTAHGDVLTGNNQANLLIGLDGDDTLSGGAGNDTLAGGAGADYLNGGLNSDMADYSASPTWVNVDLSLQDGLVAQSGGGAGNHAEGDILVGIEFVTGSNDKTHGDVLIGNDESNWMSGGDGNDTLYGGSGVDTLWGGDGDDSLQAGLSLVYVGEGYADLLLGGAGNDTLDGTLSARASMLCGGTGADRIIGNGRDSHVNYQYTGHRDVFDFNYNAVYVDLNIQDGRAQSGGPAGNDAIGDILSGIVNVVGSWGDDTIIGNKQNNNIFGEEGDDVLEGCEGADMIYGGKGYDIASYRHANAGVNVSLKIQGGNLQVGNDGDAQKGDALWYIDGLWGSDHADTLIGTDHGYTGFMSMHNVLNGYGGDDLLSGLAGDDTLDGGADNDTLIGGSGNDLLLGGAGNDLLIGGMTDTADGGDGFDTFRLEDNAGTGGTFDLSAMSDAGRITGIESIDISGDVDDANALTLKASDVLGTTGGADTLWVRGDGNDSVTTTDSGWQLVGVETGTDGQQYNHYSGYAGSTLVNLMIDADMAQLNVLHA
ncbi:MAG: calcium-binding protein, partial [Desulfomicrobium sp.]|nr:calcium-binding protein [Pseudomonadota bacterium]MBU4593755.1 calcium-binding protein [Pseudomonadota bacterium]MBV1713100.1 calcium-binding protein [Desulfomicrobium sp.]MBV1746686.1 calcium-binding protein [Desulfomicrobium sp.]